MSWIYEQDTGRALKPDASLHGIGYAGGNCGKNPEGVNNHAMQFVHNVGPLPVGGYTMGAMIEGSKLGPHVIPLIPDENNDMRGRGHFFIHGDMIGHPGEGSEGCIVLAPELRLAMAASPDRRLNVVYTGDQP